MSETIFEYYLKIPKSDLGPKGTNHEYFKNLINRLGLWRSELVGFKVNLLGETYYVRMDFVHPRLPSPDGPEMIWTHK